MFIPYLDENNLYGYAMCKPLSIEWFIWKPVIPNDKEIKAKEEEVKHGMILEVGLAYLQELLKEHNSYPLTPEKKKWCKKIVSSMQKGWEKKE